MKADIFAKPILVVGCGNPLMGDDGFGSEVIARLSTHYLLPPSVHAEDVGTGILDLLFNLIQLPQRPTHLFIVDTVSVPDRIPGELFEIDLDHMSPQNQTEFSLHQFPSTTLFREMNKEAGILVRILVVQAKHIPDCIQPGLSGEVQNALDPACNWIAREVKELI
ncbi:MAG: hydrogenase maturation protease [Pseudomonadota bacterium]